MTLLLATVTGRDEAETAIAGGADIVDLIGPLEGVKGLAAALAGRCLTSAFGGVLGQTGAVDLRERLGGGLDFLRLAVTPGKIPVATAKELADAAGNTRIVAVLFAKHGDDPDGVIPTLVQAGCSGIMLDVADPAAGRLLSHLDVPAIGAWVRDARAHGLLVGLAGGLEVPDIPRLLPLAPDFLGFGETLRMDGAIDPGRLASIRSLIPRSSGLVTAAGRSRPEPGDNGQVVQILEQRIFVRDLVLPVWIGAYSDERLSPQQVRFNVSVDLQGGESKPTNMGQVLSYDLITDGIAAIVAEGHIDFAETLAERIAALVLQQPRARRVTVKVEKLERGPGVVGVEIAAERGIRNPPR